MTGEAPAASGAVATIADLAGLAARDVGLLDSELTEIDLLVQQARIEAGRHEQKRAQVAERLTAATQRRPPDPAEVADLNTQVATVSKRAAVMEAQVEVLEGKQKVLRRYRDAADRYAGQLQQAAAELEASGAAAVGGQAVDDGGAALPPALSRAILTAQEDLRRDIARAMHDGPAQSLTNIVLQAQIVERLMARDPAAAQREVGQLVAMVQQTLEATKTFIFDVRPMVLDDLGLVPTLRRAARERSRKAGVPIEFESFGPDRRLGMDVESGLFRIIDEALVGLLAGHPARVAIRLDWDAALVGRVRAHPASTTPGPVAAPAPDEPATAPAQPEAPRADLPPALAAMMEDRRADRVAAAAAPSAPVATTSPLPTSTWREIRQRAATIGVIVTLGEDGLGLTVEAVLPAGT